MFLESLINFTMTKIYDLHNDYFVEIRNHKLKEKYLSKANKQGLFNVCSAVWTTTMTEMQAFACITQARSFASKHNINYSVEDLHFVNLDNVESLVSLGPIYTGLTWNEQNNLACGSHGVGDVTKLGKDIINILENNNIQIDTAHLNEKSFLTFANITQKPILCSHTAFSTKSNHPRNLKDYQLKIISESGGLIGLALVSDFLNSEKQATVNDIITHIDYFVSRYGIDSIALGTDFYGTTNLPRGIKAYKDLSKVYNKLIKMGYTNDTIEKIFFKNAQEFFDKK